MRVWRPLRSAGAIIAFLLTVVLWTGASWLGSMLLAPVTGWTFWFALGTLLLVALGGLFLYWGVALLTLRYVFDRNGLIVHWGASRQVIPMTRITAIRGWQDGERVREWGLRWPGCHRGAGRSSGLGRVVFYATAGRRAQILICTAEGAWVLSPRKPDDFIQEMEIRRDLGINRQLAQERLYWGFFAWGLWRDVVLWIVVALAVIANISLFALLCYRYPALSPLMPIHFSELFGEGVVADIIGQKQDLFKLPAFGLVVLAGNVGLSVVLHRRHRSLARIVAAVALLVQVMFWMGALFVLLYRRGS